MSDLDRIAAAPALEIGEALAGGRTDPLTLARHFLDRAEAQTSPVYLKVTRDRAEREAVAAGERLAAGRPLSPLDGVPIAWKDLVDMAGETTTAGSALHRDDPPAAADASIVARATAAGMVSLGKLNLTEFAYSGLGLNPHFGTPANPHGPTPDGKTRAPGGSSSGSGVAVAAGLAPCAIGTDTGGSVRVPAAFNGLVGYKSSEGRIDKTGVFDLSPTLDTVGPLARSVPDCIALDAVLRGRSVPEVEPIRVGSLTFVVPDGVVVSDLEEAVAANFEASIGALEATGATILRKAVPALDDAAALAAERGTIVAAEAWRVHRAVMEGAERGRVDRRVVARIALGEAISDAVLNELLAERRRLMGAVAATLDGAFLLMPTVAHVAPAIAALEDDDEAFHAMNLRTLRNTALGNFLNLPGLALPDGADRGTDAAGMPTSLLVSTVADDDDRLLAAGIEIETIVRAGRAHQPGAAA